MTKVPFRRGLYKITKDATGQYCFRIISANEMSPDPKPRSWRRNCLDGLGGARSAGSRSTSAFWRDARGGLLQLRRKNTESRAVSTTVWARNTSHRLPGRFFPDLPFDPSVAVAGAPPPPSKKLKAWLSPKAWVEGRILWLVCWDYVEVGLCTLFVDHCRKKKRIGNGNLPDIVRQLFRSPHQPLFCFRLSGLLSAETRRFRG